ncbi:hypothetical protein EMCRGX_G002176 [Ephydatia muelleri]
MDDLGGVDDAPNSPNVDFTKMVFFYGKEMKTTPNSGIFRVGVSREGVFKLANEDNKILAHWKYSDITDWTFSGYSFSLTTQGNTHHYIRTDDGDSLCKYIEAFVKDPEHAMEMAALNPPMSKFPDNAVKSLSRKFSSAVNQELGSSPPNDGFKFYTLTRKPPQRTHVDGVPREKSLSMSEGNPARYSNGFSQERDGSLPQARSSETPRPRSKVSTSYLQVETVASPPRAADESPDLINLTSPPPTNLVVGQREGVEAGLSLASPVIPSPTPAPAAVGGVVRAKKDGSKSAANMLWSRRVSEGKEGKDGATAPVEPRAVTPTGAPGQTAGAQQNEPAFPLKSTTTFPLPLIKHDPSPLRTDSNECSSSCSDSEHGSPFRRSAPPGEVGGAGGGGGSSTDLLHAATTKYTMTRVSCESEVPSYDKLLGCFSESGNHASTGSEDPSRRLLPLERESPLHHHHTQHQPPPQRRPNVYEEITTPYVAGRKGVMGGGEQQVRSTTRVGGAFLRLGSHSPSDDDDNYDHLPGSRGESPAPSTNTNTSLSPPPSYGLAMGDRSISQPVLTRSRLPLSPQTSGNGDDGVPRPAAGGKALESLDENREESRIGGGEGGCGSEGNPSEQRPLSGGVVLRSKPKPPAPLTVPPSTASLASKGEGEGEEPDPFEELMTRPTASSRLRWSQELNPLYDYFKGAKFTQKMASLDYVLYENAQEENTTPTSATTTTSSTEGEEPSSTAQGVEPDVVVEGNDDMPEEGREGEEASLIADQTMAAEDPGTSLATAGEVVGVAMSSPTEATPSSTLPRPRRSHMYEDVSLAGGGARGDGRPRSYVGGGVRHQSDVVSSSSTSSQEKVDPVTLRHPEVGAGVVGGGGGGGVAPIANVHIGKRQILLHQRRSRTIASLDDLAVTKRKQKPLKAADNMKDFSYVMREFRVFYIQMPNGNLLSDAINITRPVSEVIEKLCYHLGVEDSEVYVLYLTGSCLTSLRETGVDSGDDAAIHFKVNRKGSFIHLVDHQALPDQGNDPILLKNNLSLKMQGITTSRILLLQREQDVDWPVSNIVLSPEDEFNKCWLSIVQGNTPCSMEQAVRLAAIQYQAYVQHRTAMNSTVAFCRPIDFLPVEYAGVRGIDQKMYKEQESLNLKSEKDIYTTYRTYYTSLPTHDTIFFPAREPRRKLLHSTKLKPILIGVNSKGVLRVDHRTKEVLDMWDYQVLKNWAYSKRTFVLAFANKNYPMESIQARWISTLVDFHVDSILDSAASLGKLIADANNNQ